MGERYLTTLLIYPELDCGERFNEGKPCEVKITHDSLGFLTGRCGMKKDILKGLKEQGYHAGYCFVEETVTKLFTDEWVSSDTYYILVTDDYADIVLADY